MSTDLELETIERGSRMTVVRVRGRLWFYEGTDIDAELAQAKLAFN